MGVRRHRRGEPEGARRARGARHGQPLRPRPQGAEAGDLLSRPRGPPRSLEKDDTPWTPAVPLFLALREALLLLKEETLEGRLARTHRLAEATRSAADALGIELYADRAHASDTVTALKNPDGMDDSQIRKPLLDRYNVELQGGQGAVKGKIFRIGHMGIADWPDLLVTFAALERILGTAGRLKNPGASLSAITNCMP